LQDINHLRQPDFAVPIDIRFFIDRGGWFHAGHYLQGWNSVSEINNFAVINIACCYIDYPVELNLSLAKSIFIPNKSLISLKKTKPIFCTTKQKNPLAPIPHPLLSLWDIWYKMEVFA